MASGPARSQSNRFSILDTTPAKKKRKEGGIGNMSPFPILPELKAEDPKYIIVESGDSNKPLSSFSCFGVHRSLLTICKDVISISQLRDGNLLLLVKNKSVAQKFIAAKTLTGICNIVCKYHENLNFSKGTVYAPFLNNVEEDEIVKELFPQGVVSAFKFKKRIEGKEFSSGVVLLTFDLYNLPQKVDIAWTKVQCKQYIPSPMRCRSCNLLGHTQKYCKRPPSCVNCGLPPHDGSDCSRTFCVNCFQEHAASSKECTKFEQAKELIKIKTVNKCSVTEALKIQKQQTPNTSNLFASYSSVVANNKNSSTVSPSSDVNNKKSNNKQPIQNQTALISPTNNKRHSTNNLHLSNNISPLNPNITDNSNNDPTYLASLNTNINNFEHNTNNYPLKRVSLQKETISSSSLKLDDIELSNFSSSSPYSSHSLFQPLPSLQKVLSSQNLNLSGDEFSS